MAKKENADIFMTDIPPGFTPEPSISAAAQSSRDQNLTCTDQMGVRRLHNHNCSGHHEQQQPPSLTAKNRSPPEFYTPPSGPQPPRRRGRPPKDRSAPQLPPEEIIETRNSNLVFSTPFTRRQAQALHITTQRSSTEACNQAGEQVPFSCHENDTISQDIGPKILQHVVNALHYIAGSESRSSSDINKTLVDTLKAINKKHGDITRDCSLDSDWMKTLVLLGICKVVQDLQSIQLKDLDISILDSSYTVVKDAENMKVNVQWLRSRLDHIKDAAKLGDEAKELENEKNRRLQNIEKKKKEMLLHKVELERLKSEIRHIEDEVAKEEVTVLALSERIGAKAWILSQFQHMYLMDGLV